MIEAAVWIAVLTLWLWALVAIHNIKNEKSPRRRPFDVRKDLRRK